jgi:hypothetical protein
LREKYIGEVFVIASDTVVRVAPELERKYADVYPEAEVAG